MNYLTKNRICTINCYWGPWPKWFSLFIETCKHNSNIDWLFFSDNSSLPDSSENIKLIKFSKDNFNTLSSEKLNLNIHLHIPYKICDFKPTFGKIFEDYLTGYDFWGYFDIDLLFGNTYKFLNYNILDLYDIISTYKNFLSGPFVIFRNRENLNLLFRRVFEYERILQDPKHYGFDENIEKGENIGISFRKMFYGFIFLINQLSNHGVRILKISKNSLLYDFQWYYKRKTIKTNHLVDMTEVIWEYSKQKKARVLFSELIESDRSYLRNQILSWKINWKNGVLVDVNEEKELLGFHFVDNKNTIQILFPKELIQITQISITEKNIKVE